MKHLIKILAVLIIAFAISFSIYAQQQVQQQQVKPKIKVPPAKLMQPNYEIDFRQTLAECPSKDIIEAAGAILFKDARIRVFDKNRSIISTRNPVRVVVNYKKLLTQQIETVNVDITMKATKDSQGRIVVIEGFKTLKPGEVLLIDKTYGIRFTIGTKNWKFTECPQIIVK